MTATASTTDRLIEIIRRDLKLGTDVDLLPETALFGGELDLDSLDALLLVQSVQKEFDVKVPTDAIGPEIFASIATLTDFVQSLVGDAAGDTSGPARANVRSRTTIDQLPHRPPFLFVTGDVELAGDGSGRAAWRVTGHEPFFQGHFPGHPIVPGVLIGEALAQLCGLILIHRFAVESASHFQAGGAGTAASGKLAHIDVRFDHAVTPPATITLEGRLGSAMGVLWQFDVRARVGDTQAAHGSLSLVVPSAPASA